MHLFQISLKIQNGKNMLTRFLSPKIESKQIAKNENGGTLA